MLARIFLDIGCLELAFERREKTQLGGCCLVFVAFGVGLRHLFFRQGGLRRFQLQRQLVGTKHAWRGGLVRFKRRRELSATALLRLVELFNQACRGLRLQLLCFLLPEHRWS